MEGGEEREGETEARGRLDGGRKGHIGERDLALLECQTELDFYRSEITGSERLSMLCILRCA